MRSFKVGRFVNTPHGIGIMHDTQRFPSVVVHLIDKKGETTDEIKYDVSDIELTEKPLKSRVAVQQKD